MAEDLRDVPFSTSSALKNYYNCYYSSPGYKTHIKANLRSPS
jgi:hypothetical protein